MSQPSDRFFRAVFAGGAGDGSANLVFFDPSMAEARGNGSGNVPADTRAVLVELFYSDGSAPVGLTGTWQDDGTFVAVGQRSDVSATATPLRVTGTVQGGSLTALVSEQDPYDPEFSYESELTGFDIQRGQVMAFCGSYEGSASGAWNFVVHQNGQVTGAYSLGPLSGSASGNTVNLNWSYAPGPFCEGGGRGTGTGTIDENQTISGSWSGNACGDPYSGSWRGSPCASPSAEVVAPPAGEACSCGSQLSAGGSFCCPAPGPCCYAASSQIEWN